MPDTAVAVFAKAPVAGYAKTRLIPLLGAKGAARLQEKLIERTLATAVAAAVGPVALWCAPDTTHPSFQSAARRYGVALANQPAGDLGQRMLAAFSAARSGGLVLIGTDCPVLDVTDLAQAVALLTEADVVMAPAEDGGYGLIAAGRPLPELFEDMPWGTEQVAELTRREAQASGLRLAELHTIWDVDTPADVERLRGTGLLDMSDIAPAATCVEAREARRL